MLLDFHIFYGVSPFFEKLIYFLRERDSNMNERANYQVGAPNMPLPGTEPAIRACALPGNGAGSLAKHGTEPTHGATLARAPSLLEINFYFNFIVIKETI